MRAAFGRFESLSRIHRPYERLLDLKKILVKVELHKMGLRLLQFEPLHKIRL